MGYPGVVTFNGTSGIPQRGAGLAWQTTAHALVVLTSVHALRCRIGSGTPDCVLKGGVVTFVVPAILVVFHPMNLFRNTIDERLHKPEFLRVFR